MSLCYLVHRIACLNSLPMRLLYHTALDLATMLRSVRITLVAATLGCCAHCGTPHRTIGNTTPTPPLRPLPPLRHANYPASKILYPHQILPPYPAKSAVYSLIHNQPSSHSPATVLHSTHALHTERPCKPYPKN